jgi:hypothetical protein
MFARIWKHRPAPAMVVAIAALVVALGGTSYAAVKLSAGSVGTKQLKNSAVTTSKLKKNSVTGAKVKNGSLSAGDFKASSLPTGPIGPTGPKGDPGNTNAFTYKRTAIAGQTITIATFGPFTLSGECSGTESNPTAQWTLSTSAEHSAFTDYDNSYLSDFGPTDGAMPIEYSSTSSNPSEPQMEGPYDGTFAALSPNLATYITGSLSTGTYVGGPTNPPCVFDGVVFNAG